MKNYFSFIMVFSMTASLLSFSQTCSGMNVVLDIQHWETTQGSPVYFVRTPELPMLDVQVVFNSGSSRDGGKQGIAELTNSLLDEGTDHLSADQIAQRFDDVGASYVSLVNREMALLGFRSLTAPEFLKPTLETFAAILTAPSFPESEFQRVKKQMFSAQEEQKQSPSTLAKNAFYASLYPNQPYGHSTLGTHETVSKLTLKDVKDFYKKYYGAKNAIVLMVGDVTLENAHQIAEQITTNLATGEVISPLEKAIAPPSLQKSVSFPSQQTTIFMGHQVSLTPNDTDYFPLLVGNYTLGGSGLVSRLFEHVREKRGLVYNISSYFLSLQANGPFALVLQTRNEEAQNALDLTRQVLDDFIKKGPTDKELVAAKKNLIGGFGLEIASNSDILSKLLWIAFYKLPLDYLDHYREKIQAVTSEEIRTVFQKYISLNKLVTVTVGPTNSSPHAATH